MRLRVTTRSAQAEDCLLPDRPATRTEPNPNENSPEINKKLCEGCAKCCVHVNHEIDPPRNDEDCDYIIWFLLHENITVWVDDEHVWYIEFKTPCKALQDELCSIYERRPQVCREYSQVNCLNTNLDDDITFHSPEEFLTYVRKNKIHDYQGFYRDHRHLDRWKRVYALVRLAGVSFLVAGIWYSSFLLGVTTPLAITLLLLFSCAVLLAPALGNGVSFLRWGKR